MGLVNCGERVVILTLWITYPQPSECGSECEVVALMAVSNRCGNGYGELVSICIGPCNVDGK